MLETIKGWFASIDFDAIAAHTSNDQLIAYVTHPVGIGIAVALLALTFFMKWRITFVCMAGVLAG